MTVNMILKKFMQKSVPYLLFLIQTHFFTHFNERQLRYSNIYSGKIVVTKSDILRFCTQLSLKRKKEQFIPSASSIYI